jgi:hypothetical protein
VKTVFVDATDGDREQTPNDSIGTRTRRFYHCNFGARSVLCAVNSLEMINLEKKLARDIPEIHKARSHSGNFQSRVDTRVYTCMYINIEADIERVTRISARNERHGYSKFASDGPEDTSARAISSQSRSGLMRPSKYANLFLLIALMANRHSAQSRDVRRRRECIRNPVPDSSPRCSDAFPGSLCPSSPFVEMPLRKGWEKITSIRRCASCE